MATSNPAQLRRQLLRDFAPSSEQQSMGWIQWRNMGGYLGQPFDSTNIPLNKLRQMRRDPMIAFALQFVKLPLVRAPWFIECEDARIAAFATEALRLIYERLMMQFALKYDYGYQALVKNFTAQPVDWTYSNVKDADINSTDQGTVPVWTGTADPVLWKVFTTVPPEYSFPEWTDSGDFDGFYRSAQAVPGVSSKPADGYVDVDHALWITNEKDSKHGSIWGYPRIGYAYRYWWSYWYAWALRDRWMERTSDPSVVVRYPADRVLDDETGEVLNLRQVAEALGQDVRAGCTITLPNTMIKDADGNPTTQPEWDISYLEHTSKTSQEFQDLFDYLDIMKLRSCLVPERALIIPSQRGSASGVTEQLADFFTESQATEMVEFADLVNKYMIPQLIQVNFPEFKGKCRWISRGFSSADRTLILQLLTLVGQKNPENLDIDIREIMEQLQVPVKSPEQIQAEKDQMIQDQKDQFEFQMQQAALHGHQPPGAKTPGGGMPNVNAPNAPRVKKGQMGPQNKHQIKLAELDAIPGVRAGINQQGLYYDPRERIILSDYPVGPFAKKVSDLRYFNGQDESLDLAQQIYEAWEKAYRKVYKNAAKHIKSRLVALAEGGINEDAADALTKQMHNETIRIFQDVLDKTTLLNKKLAAIAANKEMKVLHLPIEWEVDNQDIKNWMRIHGAQLVRDVSESTRRELAKLISEELGTDKTPAQIASSIEEKFSQWPGWKAERIARSESRDAYNAGTLLAAQKSGITHARASDASGGTNLHTDQECIDRNGQIYPIAEALHIQDHPNGTLAWAPLIEFPLSEDPVEDDTVRLKEAVRQAQKIKWTKQGDKWWTNLGHALVSYDGPSQPARTVTARLLYLTEDLEEDIEINLSQEPHGFADVTTGPGVINFWDVKRKLGNGAKIPEELYLSALAEGVLE